MRANEIFRLDEVSMSASSLEKVLDDPDILLGYEIEFVGKQIGIKTRKEITFANLLKKQKNEEPNVYYNKTKAKKHKNGIIKAKIEQALKFKKAKLIKLVVDYYKTTHSKWEKFYTEDELYDFIKTKILNRTLLIKMLKNMFIELEDKEFVAFIFKNERLDIIKDINLKLYFLDDDWEESEDPIMFSDDKIIIAYYESYEDSLRSEFGLTFGAAKSTWKMEDESLDIDQNDEEGYELISPPMPIKESLDILMKIFDWMERNNIKTNESTGLHMGISFTKKEQTKNVDPLKLLMFIDENYILKVFKRTANEFAESHEEHLQSMKTVLEKGITAKNSKSVQKFLDAVRKNLTLEKHRSLNIGELQRRGYFEVRMAGNKDYHKRHDDVRKTALRYGKALQIAFSSEHQKEYVKKVYKLLQRILGNVESVKKGDVIATKLSRIVDKEVWDSYLNLENSSPEKYRVRFGEFIKSFEREARSTWGPRDEYIKTLSKSDAAALLSILKMIVKKYGLNINALKRGNGIKLVRALQAKL